MPRYIKGLFLLLVLVIFSAACYFYLYILPFQIINPDTKTRVLFPYSVSTEVESASASGYNGYQVECVERVVTFYKNQWERLCKLRKSDSPCTLSNADSTYYIGRLETDKKECLSDSK